MKYSTVRPTVEGFYWVKCAGGLSGRVYETVVKPVLALTVSIKDLNSQFGLSE